MALFIMRISVGPTKQERLPGNYDDDQQAEQALAQVLSGYKIHGRNDAQSYWWARDNEDREFRFVISGSYTDSRELARPNSLEFQNFRETGSQFWRIFLFGAASVARRSSTLG
jgi:hypothetical protein